MLLLSPTTLAAAALLFLGFVLIRRLSSPLRKVPGPPICGFISLPLKWNELTANRTSYIHHIHQRYGPVVRIAPNEVSFTSWPALKEIYCSSGSGYDKTEFYNLFRIYGRRTMFTTLNKGDHAKRKRLLADRYANSNVMRSSSIAGVQERSKRFVDRCANSGGDAEDIFMSLHSYACDCVTHHLFHPYGSDCLRSKEDEDMMHQVAADDSSQNRLIYHYSPNLHRIFAGVLYFFARPRETPLADNFVLDASRKTDPEQFTLMSRLREKKDDVDSTDMAAECLDHMAAGIDTTGDGLCFLMWELSQPRSLHYQRRLQEELMGNAEASFDQLVFLDAVINEALRCFPPIPMSLPRYVPEGGRMIDGYNLPERTIVSCQAFSVHRMNQQVFPNPEKFDPDRWLNPDGDTERRRLMFAFSNGGRGCVGKHLATAEMKILLKDVYSRFSTIPHQSMTEEFMVMSDQLISSRPKGQRCLLHFHPL